MAGTAADVARIATAEVGYREGRSGGHWNNKTKYAPAVAGLEWADWQAWCATFVSWVAMTAGAAALFPRTASCAAGVAWFKARDQWSEYPAVGAQVFFGPGGGSHTGIVIDYDTDTITTIEGNTNTSGSAEGDGVYRKIRQRRDAYVYGYGYPDYPGDIKSADPNWKNPSKETDVALTADDLDKIRKVVWESDKAAAPKGAADIKTNSTWQYQSYLKDTNARVRAIQTAEAAQTAAITALAKLVGKNVDTAVVVAAVREEIRDAVVKVSVDINGQEA
ncbi:CHAP domain-containing protein [Streptomyces sp. BE230]|uniref:CHAP domain-containing protein n=1 Tax=Streptomyces sp. BE230 TaxID=3002526 RepID=UPI002ED1C584|nr:CHAP domain-containing protein [Streptomyces sp. BE230]